MGGWKRDVESPSQVAVVGGRRSRGVGCATLADELDAEAGPSVGGSPDLVRRLTSTLVHTIFVHTNAAEGTVLRNITLSAEEQLIERARDRASTQKTTLNAAFRNWLAQYTAEQGGPAGFDALMAQFDEVDSGRAFSREEMNER